MNMVVGNNAFQRRLDYLFRRRRNHVKRKMMAINVVEQLREKADMRFEANLFPDFDQVLPPDAPVLRVVQQQVG